jgi:hypothetical protein
MKCRRRDEWKEECRSELHYGIFVVVTRRGCTVVFYVSPLKDTVISRQRGEGMRFMR